MGLLTEFPILVCDLAAGTDAIMGTDVLGSVLPHTLDIKNGLLFTEGVLHYSYTAEMTHNVAFSQLDTALFLLNRRLYCTYCWGTKMPSSGLLEGLTDFAENSGIVIGRILVDPSRWRVPVLVSNFGQYTLMVEPFSEVGMVTQVSTIQAVTEDTDLSSCNSESLPMHFREHPGTCMKFNNASWRVSFFVIQICFLSLDQH